MKKQDFINSIGCSIVIIFLGALMICAPLLEVTNITFLYRLFFGVYGVIQLGQFLILYRKKDYTNFFAFAVSFGLLIASFIWNLVESPKSLAFSLLVWIAVISLVKLKKADYYHDRKSRVWCMEVCYLCIFLLSGLLTCLNFAYQVDTQILLLGFFVFISGILETSEAFLLYLTKGKLK